MVDDDDFVLKKKTAYLEGLRAQIDLWSNAVVSIGQTNEQTELLLKQQKEIAVRNVNWYTAQYQFHDKNTYDTGNFVWNPYPVQWLDDGQSADQSI
eukprot:247460-Prymnesium_polylepis.1